MDWSGIQEWLGTASIAVVGVTLFAGMCFAAALGIILRIRHDRRSAIAPETGDPESYLLSAVLGLVALLLGFTFSVAADRFDARRVLVAQEANAIQTAYLRSQLLGEPHRTRMSDLLVRYTDNRLALAQAPPDRVPELLTINDSLISDMWAGTAAAFDSVKDLDFSSTFVESINDVVNLGARRKTARLARVPAGVEMVLFVFLVVSAAVLGYVMSKVKGRLAAGLLLTLFTLTLVLIIDLDRPKAGSIVESQLPMEELRKSLAAWSPSTFDRWRNTIGSK